MAELAGLAVGIVPVVLCAIKGHRKLSRGLSHMRNFSKEVNEFTIKLDHQQVCFDAICEELLAEVVEHHIAAAMIANDAHPFWSSNTIERDVTKLLGPRTDLWIRTINVIEDKLVDLNVRKADLVEDLKMEKRKSKEKHRSLEQWVTDFNRKAKACLQKTGLEQSLRDLKDHVECLEKLCSKTVGSRKAEPEVYKHQQTYHANLIRTYEPTRQASQEVYNVLLGACNQHPEHHVNLCVDVKQPPYTTSSEFLFTLALEHANAGKEPVWLEIKISLDQISRPGVQPSSLALEDPVNKRKNLEDSDCCTEKRKKRRQVTMQLKPTVIASGQHSLDQPVFSLTEVTINGNICEFLRRWCPLQGEAAKYRGILPSPSCWRCIVSPAWPPTRHQSRRPMSLKRLISLIAKRDDLRILMIGERIRLARLLTTALLRYHSTNWGRACCQSEQIQLFDINEMEPLKPIKLTFPHLATRIQGPNGTHLVQPGEAELKRIKGAPNTEFFYLSILLLQIAHGKDWAKLQEENPLRNDMYGEDAEYDRVLDLAQRRDSGMPPRYHQAIVNLLKCSALESGAIEEKIQGIVHQDVIMPLEELEKLSLED